MWRRVILVGALVLVLIAVALPLLMDREQQPLTQALRQKAPGDYIKLASGVTHIRKWGAKGAPLIVLVHGFNGPMTTWNKLAPLLAKGGYQVLAYDLLGRGFSDRPKKTYDLSLFVKQLKELVDKEAPSTPFVLMGSSFGCVVSTAFTLEYPKKVKQLALLGPAGFPAPSERLKWLLKIPFVSDYLYKIIGDNMMQRATHKYYVSPDKHPQAHKDFRLQQSIYGFKYAALSTLRNAPLHHFEKGWERLGNTKREVLLIWGTQDVSFPYKNHTLALKLMPQAKLISIKGTAHLPFYEKPKLVSGHLLRYLSSRVPPAKSTPEKREPKRASP